MLSRTYCARRVRKIATRCHSVFETHSSSAFFQDRCVATERTVKFVPLPLAWRCSGSAPTNPTSVTELRYMSFSFFCPILLRHPKRGLLLARRAAAFREGPNDFGEEPGKAEDGKPPGAGIRPKPCPGNERQKKGRVPDSARIVRSGGRANRVKAEKRGSRVRFGIAELSGW